MKKLTEWLTKPFIKEDIEIPLKVGDTIEFRTGYKRFNTKTGEV